MVGMEGSGDVKPLCQQQGSTRVMEGGQERKDCEEGGEAQCQELANNCRSHTEAKGL